MNAYPGDEFERLLHGTRQDRARELHETAYAVRVAFHAQDAQYEKAMKALDGEPDKSQAEDVQRAMQDVLKFVGAKR